MLTNFKYSWVVDSFYPLMKSLAIKYDLGRAYRNEIKSANLVSKSGGSLVLVVSLWKDHTTGESLFFGKKDGYSSRGWGFSTMENDPYEYDRLIKEIVSSQEDEEELFWVHIYDFEGNGYTLSSDIRSIYRLDKLDD